MQTTLLGIAITIILALVTALVGPLFVDWGRYRAEFEAHASRMTGLNVRVAGPIDVRLLPTPTLVLQQVEIARSDDSSALKARKLGLELALNALVRGEIRASNARIEGGDIAIGLDRNGKIDWPAPAVTFDADAVSIQQLDVVDSRAVLTDAVSRSRLVLDNLEFKGEVRSLAGAVKGEGSFYIAGQHYPYRVAASRATDDRGGLRLRVAIDPINKPFTADADTAIWIENGTPRFDGNLQVTRPVGRAAAGTGELIIEPWRVTTRVKGDGTTAVLEQIEFQYGPDDRAIKMRGDARISFGAAPQIDAVMFSPSVDLDRILALPDSARRRPLIATRSVAELFVGTHLPLPVKVGISVENLTLAGATLQRVIGDVRSVGDKIDVESLDFRAPGVTQVRLSGRLDATPKGISFAGPARVEARDPRALVAWLTDRSDAQAVAGPFRAEGEVNLASDAIAIDHLKAELDRLTLEGRLAYAWPDRERPARLEAALTAPEIDLDRAAALAQGVFAETEFQWPREGKVTLKAGKASIAGVEAQRADVNLSFDQQGIDIQQLTISDFGGTAIAAKGGIDSRTMTPRGTITVDFDARGFDGIATAVERISQPAADHIRRMGAKFAPAKLRATLALDANVARVTGTPVGAKLAINGNAGAFRVNLQTDAGLVNDALAPGNLPKLAAVQTHLTGQIDAADASALVALIGLDGVMSVNKGAGRLSVTASGPLDGRLAVDGGIAGPGLNATASGTLRLTGGQGATASLALKIVSANLKTAHQTLPATLTARLGLADNIAAFNDLAGKVGGTDISGRLSVGLGKPAMIDGEIKLGVIDLPAAIATVVGVPQKANNTPGLWPADPFEPGLLSSLNGQIKVSAGRVSLTPKLSVLEARGILRVDPNGAAFESLEGTLAGGRASGALTFQSGADGLTSHTQLHIAGAEIGDLLPGDTRAPLSGHLTLDAEFEGAGRSAVAAIGSLKGMGTFTLQDGRMARLDPAAFDAVMRSVDLGLPVEAVRIRDRVESALSSGALTIPLAEGTLTINGGQLRLANTSLRGQGADLAVSGSLDLATGGLDGRLTLVGPAGTGAPGSGRPEIGIALKGPLDASRRTLDVSILSSWLALRAVEQQANRLDALESGRADPSPNLQPPATTPAPQPRAGTSPSATGTTTPRPTQRTPPSADQAPLDLRPPAVRAPRAEGRPLIPRPANPPTGRSELSIGP